MEPVVPSSIPSAAVSRSTKSSLNFLLRRIRRNPEFPAISEHITEITQKLSGEEKGNTEEISNIILKDYALTHKILRLVNSASYGNYGGEISTISRAVVILGYERVKTIALSVILFESLGNSKQKEPLKDSICSSFLSAIVAKRLADDIHNIDVEQAFISSMFNNLGEFLTIHYFPEEYSDIKQQQAKENSNHNQVIRDVLGASYSELGMGIAEEWKLPESIVTSMQEQPEGNILKGDSDIKSLSHLSSFCNELSSIAGSERLEVNKAYAIESLSSRYQKSIQSTPELLQMTLTDSLKELSEFADAIGINVTSSHFYHHLTTKIEHPPEQDDIEIVQALEQSPSQQTRQLSIIKGITDITQTMLSNYELGDVIKMIVETIYRGIGFDHVIFCLRNNPKKIVKAHFGLGDDIARITPKFLFKTYKSNDIFNLAVNNKKEFVILNTSSSEYKNKIPDWCKALTKPAAIVVFPVIVNDRCIGILYADNGKKTKITSEEIQFFSALRNLAALAIMNKKSPR